MLVLSRRQNQTLVFPELSIKLEILKLSGSQVRIGIEAPSTIEVQRGELLSGMRALPETGVGQDASQTTFQAKAGAILDRLRNLAIEHKWHASAPAISELVRELAALESDHKQARRKSGVHHALLVDDNENESRLLASYLRIKGIDVQLAFDGQNAIDQMNQSPVDVVLLDMNMPEFDGAWTLAKIRNNPALSTATVFAVSGAEPGDRGVQVGPGGVDRWFTKPLNPEMLANAIHQYQRQHQQMTSLSV